jgi:hypothetical protein
LGVKLLVSTATGYELEKELSLPEGARVFLYFTASRPVLGLTQPPIQWVPGILSPGIKRLKHEAKYSPLSNDEVNNGGAFSSRSYKS